ncbi:MULTISPECIES: hypothetical protein [unclassified Pseudomonas]|uniref:hypothetical protein n=1 Tax=unclassified Pseudomonas TaxID=196821 RepID=UPI001CBD700C|nr:MULTISPECIES: hypothetical protein [unclassified Pseudomonas]
MSLWQPNDVLNCNSLRSLDSQSLSDRFWPILLKKSAMVFTVEKYALEIEIFTLSRGFRAQFSRSGTQKGVFSSQYAGSLEEPTFSTESADFCQSRLTEIDPWRTLSDRQFTIE